MSDISRRGFLQFASATPLLAMPIPAAAVAYEAVTPYCPVCRCMLLRVERAIDLPMDEMPHLWSCVHNGVTISYRLPYWRKLR